MTPGETSGKWEIFGENERERVWLTRVSVFFVYLSSPSIKCACFLEREFDGDIGIRQGGHSTAMPSFGSQSTAQFS